METLAKKILVSFGYRCLNVTEQIWAKPIANCAIKAQITDNGYIGLTSLFRHYTTGENIVFSTRNFQVIRHPDYNEKYEPKESDFEEASEKFARMEYEVIGSCLSIQKGTYNFLSKAEDACIEVYGIPYIL